MKGKIYRVISKIIMAIIIASLAVALPLPRLNAGFSASAHTVDRTSDAPSALQGDDAIRNLKERGLYNSLLEAVATAGLKTIAPTFSDQDQLIAGDGMANDRFGRSVAIYGDTALVGAPYDDNGDNADQGSAYVFVRDAGNSWSLLQKLTASDGAAYDYFGLSVAIYWDFAVVGAPFDDIGARPDQGSAYVFARGGGVWREHQKLTASDGAASDRFGYSVAINGITTVVGAPFDDVFGGSEQGYVFNTDQGSAYAFMSYFADWFQEQKLTASDGAANDQFGFSVAVHEDTLVVGAPRDDIGAKTNQGSAYVYARGGASWIEQPKLTASDGAAYDQFGYSVAIDTSAYRDTLVVGAPNDDVFAGGDQGYVFNTDQGSAYVFERDGASWVERQRLTAGDGSAYDLFGYSVAINKYTDTVVVGAPFDDNGFTYDQGSAYIFTRSRASWIEQQRLIASDGIGTESFGFSIAISLLPGINKVAVMVGAPNDDIRAMDNLGSAYMFSADIIGNF